MILIEACEESGSFDLPHYVDHLSTRLGDPSKRLWRGRPWSGGPMGSAVASKSTARLGAATVPD